MAYYPGSKFWGVIVLREFHMGRLSVGSVVQEECSDTKQKDACLCI